MMRGVGSFASRRAGFSLVELFVVTAIIGVLAAMLLPALSRAREKSRMAVCASQLRQIGQVLTMYEDVYHALPTQNFSGYLMWNGVDYVLNGQAVEMGGPQLGRIFFCPSSRVFTSDDPDTGLQNLGVAGKITASAYELRGLLQGGPRTLTGNRQALVADLYEAGEKNHATGGNVLYTDGSVRFMVLPAAWSLGASNAWMQLDQDVVARAP